MKILNVLIVSAAVLGLAACVPPNARRHFGAMKPLARMECPKRQGELTLRSASPDGAACAYDGADGSQVELRLVQLAGGDAEAALDRIETELKPLVPQPTSSAGASTSVRRAEADSDDADRDDDSWDQAPASGGGQPTAKAQPRATSTERSTDRQDGDDDHVNINLPGVHIQADGGRAKVNVAGVHVNADDATQQVHVEGGHGPFGRPGRFTIDANDGGAVIRTRSVGKDVRDSLVIAADSSGPQGWRAVGYQAAGPRSGPLVVAVVRSKDDEHSHLFEDARRLAWRTAAG